MISVVIPVLNYDVTSLVQALLIQADTHEVDLEVIIGEDGSSIEWVEKNKKALTDSRVKHFISSKDIGRAAIRNKLASIAVGDWLLFIDADSAISEQYICAFKWYRTQADVLVGGTCYKSAQPDSEKLLRWKYGLSREMVSPMKRNETPYLSFTANNFFIKKAVFDQIKFDEEVTKYGHEDTLFGLELKHKQIPILHIDNAVEHLGLETSKRFLEKSKEAVSTLAQLLKSKKIKSEDVKLLAYYDKLQKTGGLAMLRSMSAVILPKIQSNLLSDKPNLRLFDLYKLIILDQELTTPGK